MKTETGNSASRRPKGTHRMPEDSRFFDKVVPVILIVLAALTAILILATAAVLSGLLTV